MALLVGPELINGTTPSVDPNGLPAFGSATTGSTTYGKLASMTDAVQIATTLQNSISNLTMLNTTRCANIYATDYVSNYLNVLVVTTNATSNPGSILAGYQYYYAPSSLGDFSSEVRDWDWICNGVPNCAKGPFASPFTVEGTEGGYLISHCLAQPTQPQCTVQIFPQLLIIVIVFNALKAIFFIILLMKRNFTPLMTIGDAITSFMTKPDPNSLLSGPYSSESIRKMYLADPLRLSIKHQNHTWMQNRAQQRAKPWHNKRRFWAAAPGPKRWGWTVLG